MPPKHILQLLALLGVLLVPMAASTTPAAVHASARPTLISVHAPTLDAVNCAVAPAKTSLSSDEQAFLTLLNTFRASGDPAGSTPPPGATTPPIGLPAVGPVQFDNRLVQSSAWFSQDHAQNGYQTTDPTGHNNPDHVDSLGRYIDKRLADCDFPTGSGSATTDYGENVLVGYPPDNPSYATAQAALARWYDLCDGDQNGQNCTYLHRKTMLDPQATVAGIARVIGPKGGPGAADQPSVHWTLDIGNPGAGNIVAFPPPQAGPAPQTGPAGSQFAGQWTQLDNNQFTTDIVADFDKLYQRWSGGQVWEYTGTGAACQASPCPGWAQLDNNPLTAQIAAGGGNLYQRWSGGQVWQYTGTGASCQASPCPGWTQLDNNQSTADIVAGDRLYQRWSGGQVWEYTGTGAACQASPCPGWTQLDNNPLTAQIAVGGGHLYQRWSGGQVWEYTGKDVASCQASPCPGWTQLDNNQSTADIVAGDRLYQRWSGGQVWEYTGTGAACQASPCPGWTQLDANKFTAELAAAGGDLYQRWSGGQIWQYMGQPCQAQGTSCTGWALLDDQLNAVHIAAAEHDVYQLHSNGAVLRHNR